MFYGEGMFLDFALEDTINYDIQAECGVVSAFFMQV